MLTKFLPAEICLVIYTVLISTISVGAVALMRTVTPFA
jgi:hypothetical protein